MTGRDMSELSRSLQPRHVTMISIGGIIGAGLFVGSSASIAVTGPNMTGWSWRPQRSCAIAM